MGYNDARSLPEERKPVLGPAWPIPAAGEVEKDGKGGLLLRDSKAAL